MELREDEIAYLDGERCYCGHLYALHNFHCCDFCLVDDGKPGHFCSERAEQAHVAAQEAIRAKALERRKR